MVVYVNRKRRIFVKLGKLFKIYPRISQVVTHEWKKVHPQPKPELFVLLGLALPYAHIPRELLKAQLTVKELKQMSWQC
ncbi:hypothetical protein L1987_70738 [Smallanthus sonchifolius]|uniref:Uncharacterized protein n=1 Tax=Smallanthus sonchifolius TaxID=185202 RepID=A0ACB9AS33_9ASTR|nr:hypothetical protein L1987_70738 [Smallanthus sonchifolius]